MARILLAEDDDDMRRFLVKALERAGYDVSDFDNGASAYERLREEPFSLLLTDIVMPEMDGIELARRATEIDPGPQGDVHHRLRGRSAQPGFEGAEGCQGAVEALPSARSRQRGREDAAGRLSDRPFSPQDATGEQRPAEPAIDAPEQMWCMRGVGWACSSAGEHYVDIVGVTGSIPVTPTIQTTEKLKHFWQRDLVAVRPKAL